MKKLDSIALIKHLADDSIADVYDLAVDHFNGGVFVELGCYMGGSTIYLAQKVKESGKDIKIYAVDIWENMIAPGVEGSIFYVFWNNVMEYKCEQVIRPVMLDSRRAASAFEDGSVDFVYVDADHRFEYVDADIRNWLPKIKPGGWIGGHDYNQQVEKAVHYIFHDELNKEIEVFKDGCWSFLVRL